MNDSYENLPLFAPEPPAPPQGPLVRLRLTVAYLGTGFHGIAPQPQQRTVGGELVRALMIILRLSSRPPITVAGRTDAGVHAWGQVVHVDISERDLPPDGLVKVHRSLTKLLGPEIVVRTLDVAPEGFDARFSATARRYRYTLLTTPQPDPFRHQITWHVPQPLDLATLRLASDAFLGEHDFSSFCRPPRGVEEASLVRRVTDTRWVVPDESSSTGDTLRFEIEANAFCQQMVRSIVGFLVECGRGRRSPGEVLSVLAARRRGDAGPVAPPHGLCLWKVRYLPGLDPVPESR
jgi:tRNA pseudouridine38-40 synthase